jgi:16S rRNA (guanine527-N7)-methyltransferase
MTPAQATPFDHDALIAAASKLGIALSTPQAESLLSYLKLIQKWTKTYNLTAVRDPADMVTHHLLDSLAVVTPLINHLNQSDLSTGARLLDVGSGAGLPGVVIAICCPNVLVTCVDTVGKKVGFIRQAAIELKLPNLGGLHARVESISAPFDVVCSRAFASLADFTTWSRNALAEQGVWLAMKGKHPVDELAALPADVNVFHVEPLEVPGLGAERCLVWMRAV